MREYITSALIDHGYRVLHANSAAEALANCAKPFTREHLLETVDHALIAEPAALATANWRTPDTHAPCTSA